MKETSTPPPAVPVTPGADSIDKLTELGRALGVPFKYDGGDVFTVVPDKYRVESLQKFFGPNRITAAPKFQDALSFGAYVNRFKDSDSLLFADVSDTGATLLAILDYHVGAEGNPEAKAAARRTEHRATLKLEPTREWKDWTDRNGQKMGQVEFAAWLEERELLIQSPPGAELREIVQNLEGKSAVRFNSAVRLDNGKNSFVYDEDVELKGTVATRSGAMELPTVIEAGIAPFQGCAAYRVAARLRYRIDQRKLAFWYETIRTHAIVRDAVQLLMAQVQEQTKLTALMGTPG